MPYAGRAVFNRNGMLGVILGVDHGDGWQPWGVSDIGVSEEEFTSYEYRNAGTPGRWKSRPS